MRKEKFTEEQKEIIRKEMSLDNKNSKYSKYLCKLQNKLDPYIDRGEDEIKSHGVWQRLEEFAKVVKSVTPQNLGFQIPLYENNKFCKHVLFQYHILSDTVDDIILNHTKIRRIKRAAPKIVVDVATIVEDINNQVNAFLRKL